MRNPVKRACDSCIARKVRCNGAWPCATCEISARQLQCSYDKPAQKRGPKVRRASVHEQKSREGEAPELNRESENPQHGQHEIAPLQEFLGAKGDVSHCLQEVLPIIIRTYESQSYGVWPIICSDVLIQKLSKPFYGEPSVYGLATALCAATMAQLDLAPLRYCIGENETIIDGSYLSRECIHIREQYQYREHLDILWMLTSFFLHVYHAKRDQRNSAAIFAQEALTSARLLGLDRHNKCLTLSSGMIDNGEIIFPLLWVTERGYSMHLGLRPSFLCELPVQLVDTTAVNAHVKGMHALAGLFVTFYQCCSGYSSKDTLIESERLLRTTETYSEDIDATRLADLAITREWMRTMIWQQGLCAGYLSLDSQLASLNFSFPAVVGRDLLAALRTFSPEDLLPLGRDQLLKCYEVTNTLADTLLCNRTLTEHSPLQCSPYDFLHGLYQKIQPFLCSDMNLDSILRKKTAETLSRAPPSLQTLNLPSLPTEEDVTNSTTVITSYDVQYKLLDFMSPSQQFNVQN